MSKMRDAVEMLEAQAASVLGDDFLFEHDGKLGILLGVRRQLEFYADGRPTRMAREIEGTAAPLREELDQCRVALKREREAHAITARNFAYAQQAVSAANAAVANAAAGLKEAHEARQMLYKVIGPIYDDGDLGVGSFVEIMERQAAFEREPDTSFKGLVAETLRRLETAERDAEKFRDQVRDTCARAEKAEGLLKEQADRSTQEDSLTLDGREPRGTVARAWYDEGRSLDGLAYAALASRIMGVPVQPAEERHVGKMRELGMGYGFGWPQWVAQSRQSLETVLDTVIQNTVAGGYDEIDQRCLYRSILQLNGGSLGDGARVRRLMAERGWQRVEGMSGRVRYLRGTLAEVIARFLGDEEGKGNFWVERHRTHFSIDMGYLARVLGMLDDKVHASRRMDVRHALSEMGFEQPKGMVEEAYWHSHSHLDKQRWVRHPQP